MVMLRYLPFVSLFFNVENGNTAILVLYNGEQFVEIQSAVYSGEAVQLQVDIYIYRIIRTPADRYPRHELF